MAQVAKYQVPAHPSGLDMRTQLNAIVLAMIGDNSGPTEPAEKYPGMMWGDTTAMRLKRRNNANSAWIDIGPIDDFLGTIRTQASTAVQRTGDTMTGALQLYSAGIISSPLYLNSNGYAPHFRSNSSFYGFEWINGANTTSCATLSDAGVMVTSGYTLRDSCQLIMNHTKGNMRMRGDAGIGSNGGMGLINGAGNAWRFQLTDEGYWTVFNYGLAPVNIMPASGDANGFQGTLGPGYLKLNEYNYGAYIDLSRARSEDYQWRIHYNFTNGYLEFVKNAGGNIQFSPDGNIFVPAAGVWISTINANANNKAAAGAQCHWNSGINELGALAPGGGDVTRDAGDPWCMEGIRCTGGGATWIWPRTIWYRNN